MESALRATINRGASVTDRVADYIAGRGAMSSIGGSNFGSMCEVLSAHTYRSEPCTVCDGFGFRHLSELELLQRERLIAKESNPEARDRLRFRFRRDSDCRACSGTGWREGKGPPVLMDPMFTTVRCNRCKGSGEVMDEDLEDVCQVCMGQMFLIPVTVKERGSSKKGRLPPHATDAGSSGASGAAVTVTSLEPGDWVDEQALAEYGRTASLMAQLRQTSPELAHVLEEYCGPHGDRYGPHIWGRAFAVWPLTEPGARLAIEAAERSRRGHGFLLTPLELLASERNAEEQAKIPNLRRRVLIGQADKAARKLIEQAWKAVRLVAES